MSCELALLHGVVHTGDERKQGVRGEDIKQFWNVEVKVQVFPELTLKFR